MGAGADADALGPFNAGTLVAHRTLVVPADASYTIAAVGDATGEDGGVANVVDLIRCGGCDDFAWAQARGAQRSRPADALVDEALQLSERHPEIVLTGIHIGSYGRDRGTSLGALVERLVQAVPSARFRLSSVEATEVDARLAALFHEPAHLVPHLHAPLQSGSDRVLRRMGRHWYTAREYGRAVERLAATLPVFGLGADVIAGFPGETDADHAETLALVAALPFTYLHVFPFSLRPGTAAERLVGDLPGGVVQQRARALLGRRRA